MDFSFHVSRITFHSHTCRPSGALGYFVIAPGYKHAAPLGLNTSPLLTFPLSHFLVFLCAIALNCVLIRVDWRRFAGGFSRITFQSL